MQMTAHLLGGKVNKGKGEYGKANLEIVKESSLLKGVTTTP
jgi:GMP synthase (glutamine-hydrolysing)